jgi:hypothetical protein
MIDELLRKVEMLEARLRFFETLTGGQSSGTWTPAWTGNTGAGVFTYTAQTGVYTRVGNLVYIAGHLQISAIGTPPTGAMTITGLPFTCEATYYHPISLGFISNFNYPANAMQLSGAVAPSTASISLYQSFDNAGGALVQAADFTNNACDIYFNGVYRLA